MGKVTEIRKANGEVMRIIDGEYVIGAGSGCFSSPKPCRKIINGEYLVEGECEEEICVYYSCEDFKNYIKDGYIFDQYAEVLECKIIEINNFFDDYYIDYIDVDLNLEIYIPKFQKWFIITNNNNFYIKEDFPYSAKLGECDDDVQKYLFSYFKNIGIVTDGKKYYYVAENRAYELEPLEAKLKLVKV